MNDWERFCKSVVPLQKTNKITHIPKNNRKPVKRYKLDNKLDLHYENLDISFKKVNDYIDTAKEQNIKKVTIITGKSGIIKEEFPKWMENNNKVRSSTLNDNKGSFKIKLSKNK